MKLECEAEIEILEVKLAEALAAKKSYVNIEPIARKAIERLTKLDDIYYKSSPSDKRNLVVRCTLKSSHSKSYKIEPLNRVSYLVIYT